MSESARVEVLGQPAAVIPDGAELFDGPDVPVILPAHLRVGRKPAGTSDQGRTED